MKCDLAFIYDEDYLKYDFGKAHPMNKFRIQMHFDLMNALGFFKDNAIMIESPLEIDRKILLSVHDEDYVNRIIELSKSGVGVVDNDTPAFKGMFETTMKALGGTIKAVELIMNGKTSHAWNPLGGFHHAKKNKGGGFCIFNDIALAVNHLIDKYNLNKIMYIDLDAHHGDGVQDIFYDNDKLFKISIHESGETLYPHSGYINETGSGRGEGYNVNIPLPLGTFDEAFFHVLDKTLPLIFQFYNPQFIIVQAGTDAHFLDPLSHLSLTSQGYEKVYKLIHKLAHKFSNGRVLLLGGGGYSLNAAPRIWALLLSEFTGIQIPNKIPESWIEKYNPILSEFGVNEKLPIYIRDDKQPKIDPLRFEKINKVIKELIDFIQENTYLLYGFFKLIK